MLRRVALLFFVCAAVQGAHAGRYALLVGNSTAQGNYSPLRYVQNDLRSLKDILSDFCGFEKPHIVTLYNGTSQDLDQSVKSLARLMAGSKDNLFLFYYSGHADQTCLKMGAESYPFDSLKRTLTNFPSDLRIGIFDACQSGSFTRIKGGRLDEPFLFKDDGKTKGQIILCSSSINENAQESDALGNSVFTFYFVNALRGSADLSSDKRITLSEAYQYAYNHTLSNTAGSPGGVQHPSYQFRIQGEGDIVLADLNISTRGILLGADVQGDITIMSADKLVVADLNKTGSSGVMIALGPGVYTIINGKDGRKFGTTATVTDKAVVTVGQSDFSAMTVEQGQRKGEAPARPGVLQFGISLFGSGGRYDLSDLASTLRQRFDGYGNFSINPSFTFAKRYIYPAVALEAICYKRIVAQIGVSGFSDSASASYSGSHAGAANGSAYGVRLQVSRALKVKVADLGIGYRFQNRYMKNVSLNAGVKLYNIDLTVHSVFFDSLYDIESSVSGSSKGTLYVPYGAAGYRWPIVSWLDIGANLGYRYRWTLRELGSSGPMPQDATVPLKYDFSGIDGNVFVNFHLTTAFLESLL